eukprot:TRINITY_DN8172_c0_g1_i1.p1 TRINITY_DN8172_c0_g1~~TRINITY_DN8172_c0_g1_i1.p1  ORF type:complete len:425 (+),score=109.28 TRINITY_DN8172_c0_g1_i1:97-1371(+)
MAKEAFEEEDELTKRYESAKLSLMRGFDNFNEFLAKLNQDFVSDNFENSEISNFVRIGCERDQVGVLQCHPGMDIQEASSMEEDIQGVEKTHEQETTLISLENKCSDTLVRSGLAVMFNRANLLNAELKTMGVKHCDCIERNAKEVEVANEGIEELHDKPKKHEPPASEGNYGLEERENALLQDSENNLKLAENFYHSQSKEIVEVVGGKININTTEYGNCVANPFEEGCHHQQNVECQNSTFNKQKETNSRCESLIELENISPNVKAVASEKNSQKKPCAEMEAGLNQTKVTPSSRPVKNSNEANSTAHSARNCSNKDKVASFSTGTEGANKRNLTAQSARKYSDRDKAVVKFSEVHSGSSEASFKKARHSVPKSNSKDGLHSNKCGDGRESCTKVIPIAASYFTSTFTIPKIKDPSLLHSMR